MEDLADRLDALADDETARRTLRHTSCLRGIRGVPLGDVARVASELWQADPPLLPRDGPALDRAFGGAWEDGLIAIGLAATAVSEAPDAALELGLDWAERCDDVTTADALGWLILAPAALLTGKDTAIVARLGDHRRVHTRRAALAMGLGFTPTPVEGAAAAALRQRVQQRHVRIVDAPQGRRLAALCTRFVRDEAPPIQKALRRILRAWGADDPDGVEAWGAGVRGGLPRLLRDEVQRAVRHGRRQEAE